MRRIIGLALLLGMLALSPATGGASRPDDPPAQEGGTTQLVDVSTPSHAERTRLQQLGLDLTEHGDADSVAVVLHGDADAQRLRDAGFSYTVRIADLTAREAENRRADERYAAITAVSPLPSGRDSYRHLADYEQELAQLAGEYPGLAKSITLNHLSWEGRPVVGIEITSNPAATDGKPVFVMLGAHHAREWPSAEHAIEFAYDLLRGYGDDTRTTSLVDTVRTIIVPVVNPDGFVVSREARSVAPAQSFTTHDFSMKRKNCRDVVGSCDRRTRLSGVDLNRNYGGLWGGLGASTFLESDAYRGPAPFSEPETQNIHELLASRQATMVITNHTFGNLILRPPGTIAQGFPLEAADIDALASQMASHNGYANIPGFELYDTTGTTEDWSFWSAAALTYTFEIGPTEFHPPFETGVVAEYLGLPPAAGAGLGGNREAFFTALAAAADPALHSRITGSAPPGSRLTIAKAFQTATSPICRDDFCTVTDPAILFDDALSSEMITTGSTFDWHVNPSTRPVVAGRLGRAPTGPPQSTLALLNDPAVVPDENVYYPNPAPPRLTVPYELVPFEVQGPADGVDNGQLTVHIEWANPANDWDLYVLDADGDVVAYSNAFGDTDEDAVLYAPAPGTYTALIVNYDQVSRRSFDDWSGEVRFTSPTPTTIGTSEAWTFRCEPPAGTPQTRDVFVARGESVDLGDACA